jgi:hypothetical protein
MKILKPTLIKVIIFIVIIIGAYFYNSSHFFIDIDCVPGQEESCARYAQSEKLKIVTKTTLVTGLPIAMLIYVLVGVAISRRIMTN